MPADGREHELRVSADGFLPVTRSVRFDADAEIQLALEPVPAPVSTALPVNETAAAASPAKPARRISRGKRTAARGPGELTAPAAQKQTLPDDACNPPYVVNELGIKRYKRECLGQ
jgi:hypothetical protein